MSGPSPDDLRTSDGEVVRRVDLDRAAGTPGRFHEPNPNIAGYDGVELARAALAGDRAALDEFRDLAGLVLTGVTEHNDGHEVKLIMLDVDTGEDVDTGKDRAAFQALNEGGYNSVNIDAAELVAWILSAEGRAALARRGVAVELPPRQDESMETREAVANEPMDPDRMLSVLRGEVDGLREWSSMSARKSMALEAALGSDGEIPARHASVLRDMANHSLFGDIVVARAIRTMLRLRGIATTDARGDGDDPDGTVPT